MAAIYGNSGRSWVNLNDTIKLPDREYIGYSKTYKKYNSHQDA